MGYKNVISGLSKKDRVIFCQSANRLKQLLRENKRLVFSALEIVRHTYKPSLDHCVFLGSKEYTQAQILIDFLATLNVPDGKVRVTFYCGEDSALKSELLEELGSSRDFVVCCRKPPNKGSKAAKRWIGIDLAFPSGKAFKAVKGFVVLLRFAACRFRRKASRRKAAMSAT